MIDSFNTEIKLLAVTDGSYSRTKLSGLMMTPLDKG